MRHVIRITATLLIVVLTGLVYLPVIDTERLATESVLGVAMTAWFWLMSPVVLMLLIVFWLYAQEEPTQ